MAKSSLKPIDVWAYVNEKSNRVVAVALDGEDPKNKEEAEEDVYKGERLQRVRISPIPEKKKAKKSSKKKK